MSIVFIFRYKHVVNFFGLRRLYARFYADFTKNAENQGFDVRPVGTYEWDLWRTALKDSFSSKLPINFLHVEHVSNTMVFGSRLNQTAKLSLILSMYGDSAKEMLRESIIGLPLISSFKFRSSANTIHQAYHLSSYYQSTGKNLLESRRIIEWGGGYGCLARIVKTKNPGCTYIIMDLPELSCLQYVYLSSIFGQSNVKHITNGLVIDEGKINLVSSDYVLSLDEEIRADTFISNWALTESGKEYQDYVLSAEFFSATNVLVSCVEDENNFIANNSKYLFAQKIPISTLGENNYYLAR